MKLDNKLYSMGLPKFLCADHDQGIERNDFEYEDIESKIESNQIEKDTLGMIIVYPELLKKSYGLDPEDFTNESYKVIFRKIIEMDKAKKHINSLLLIDEFQEIDTYFILDIIRNVFGTVDFDGYVKNIIEKSCKRKIKSGDVELAKESIRRMEALQDEQDEGNYDEDLSIAVMELTEKLPKRETGIKQLDEMTEGLAEGHYWVLGGYTSVGKTHMALDILNNQKEKTIFFSLEMTKIQLIKRLLFKNMQQYPTESWNVDDIYSRRHNLSIYENKHSIESIESVINEKQPKVVFIDFLQNVTMQGKFTEYEKLSEISRRLQLCALSNKCCIIALSQVSNESAKTNTGVMGFKGSGGIAANADVGIELRKENDNELDYDLICNIKKNRHGRTGKLSFTFDKTKNKIHYE